MSHSSIILEFDPDEMEKVSSFPEGLKMEKYNKFFEKLKKVGVKILEPEKGSEIIYFKDQKYYYKGKWKNNKFFGIGFFYFEKREKGKINPVILRTSIDEYYRFSSQSLIIFEDQSYYYGDLVCMNSQSSPSASGKGIFVNRDIIYQGEFSDGKFHGKGYYEAKGIRLLGEFKNGQPKGQFLQKTKQGLFMGRIQNGKKEGKIITIQNEIKQIIKK